MRTYTALIRNMKFNTFRMVDVVSFSIDGLRERIEKLCLRNNEVLCGLFPTDKMERAFK